MTVNTPSAQLLAWVEQELGILAPNTRLPTSAVLAERFGLSSRTVNTVLKPLVARGRLVRVRGKGTFTPGPEAPTDAPAVTPSSTETIVDALKQSIASGDLKFGDPLPAVTFMSRQFHVTPSTVARAYRSLASERYAVRVGRSYWIGAFKGLVYTSGNREVFLLHQGEAFDRRFADDLYTISYQKMERELNALGFVLRVAPASSLPSLARRWSLETPPYGIVLYHCDGASYEDLHRRVRQAVGRGRARVPVLVDLRSGRPPRKGEVHVLHRGNLSTATGRAVARFVVERGYSSVSFFLDEDLQHNESHFWNFVRILKIRIELANLDRAARARFCIIPSTPGLSARSFMDAEHAAVARYGDNYLSALLAKYHQLTLNQVLAETETTHAYVKRFQSHTESSLWVFSRMVDAAEALTWCRDHRVAVPDRVSILSLENDPAHFGQGISCCDIDWETIGYLMAHAIAGDIPIAQTGQGYIRCSARVIGRGTTR